MWDFSSSCLTHESLALGAGLPEERSINVRCTESTRSFSCYCFVTPLWAPLGTLIPVIKTGCYPVCKQYNMFHSLRGYLISVAQQSQILYFLTSNLWEYKSILICNFILTHRTRENDSEEREILPLSILIHSYWNVDGWKQITWIDIKKNLLIELFYTVEICT